MMFCSVCAADLDKAVSVVMHPSIGNGEIVCGPTGRRAERTTDLSSIVMEQPVTETPMDRARREYNVAMEALAYHAGHEDTPVEVLTDGGWMDVVDLLEPLGKALGVR